MVTDKIAVIPQMVDKTGCLMSSQASRAQGWCPHLAGVCGLVPGRWGMDRDPMAQTTATPGTRAPPGVRLKLLWHRVGHARIAATVLVKGAHSRRWRRNREPGSGQSQPLKGLSPAILHTCLHSPAPYTWGAAGRTASHQVPGLLPL